MLPAVIEGDAPQRSRGGEVAGRPSPLARAWRFVSRHAWIAVLFAVAALGVVAYQRHRAFRVLAFEYKPIVASTGLPGDWRSDVWLPAPYPSLITPDQKGFFFRARIQIDDPAVLDRLLVSVDDALAELTVNGTLVYQASGSQDFGSMREAVRAGFKTYGRIGDNDVSGKVVNLGGPMGLEFEVPDQELFGGERRRTTIWTAICVVALWIVLYRWFAPSPPTSVTALLLLVLTVVFSQRIVRSLPFYGKGDWDVHFFFVEAVRRAVVDFHSFPVWNAYSDGGIPLLGYPQSFALNPLMAIAALAGTIVGTKLIALLAAWLGALGMYLFARALGMRWAGAVAAAVLFQFNGATVQHLAEGHFAHHVNNWVPWSFFFLARSRFRWNKYLALSGLCLAAVLLTGEVYTLVFAVMGLLVWTACEVLRTRRLRPLWGVGGMLAACAAFSLPRGLPVIEYGLLCARQHEPAGGFSWTILWAALTGREIEYHFPEQFHMWHEYASYVGIAAVVLAAVGALFTLRRTWPALMVLVLTLWVALASFAPLNLFEGLSVVPLVNALKVPSRWNYAFLFVLFLFAAGGVDRIRRYAPRIAFFIPCLLFVDLAAVCSPAYDLAFNIAPTAPIEGDRYRLRWEVEHPHEGRYSGLYEEIRGNVGIVASYNPIAPARLARAEDKPDYKGMAFLEDTDGDVDMATWTPGSIRLRVRTEAPGILVYNQNYFPGWIARVDGRTRRAFPLRGLVAVAIYPGESDVVVSYRPTLALAGFAMAAVAALAMIAWRRPTQLPFRT